MVYRRYFEAAVSRLKDERRYRVFAHLERDVEAFRSRTGIATTARSSP